jgi:hypothetical protein
MRRKTDVFKTGAVKMKADHRHIFAFSRSTQSMVSEKMLLAAEVTT